ncbi:MAG: hypothetical protein UZ21_OP11001000202 [Microgenomates bacterium OLB22]|nr:MAG: hypothetical protein UZ21_OP11001000202 [Microgenomates bacterium OLB22]
MDITINYLSVLLAAIVPMAVGSLWYSPMMFGKKWAMLEGFDMSDKKMVEKMQKEAKPAYFITFLATLLMAYVMVHFMTYIGVRSLLKQYSLDFGRG